jgi:plastocyanin
MLSRRSVVGAGGILLAGFGWPVLGRAAAGEVVEIRMRGNADGSDVWFDPIGVLIRPGQTVRWVNTDPGNSHTSTAYHPANEGHPLRIPVGAAAWNSDYLLPEEAFEVRLLTEGVYDYFCIPHEHAGMVGRIVVAEPNSGALAEMNAAELTDEVPEPARLGFPDVQSIVRERIVRRP